MQRYWDLTEKQRANLEEEQLQHLLAVELMEAGIVRPAPPVLEDETTPTVATRRFYGITTGNGRYGGREDIGILFESETAAAAFLRDTRPLISVSDYETGKTFVKTLDDVSIVPVDVATEQAVLMLKAGFIEAKKRRERNAQAKRDYDQELREADDATKTLRDDYARCGGLAYRYERLVDTYREYVKLAGGDKHIARGFLRKAYAEVDIREAFAWCEVEDPGERVEVLAEPAPLKVVAEAMPSREDEVAF